MLERIALLPTRGGHARDAEDLPGADHPRAHHAADRGDQGAGRRRRRRADPAAGAPALRGRARGRPRHPRHPGHGRLRRARLQRRVAPAAEPQGVHPRGAAARRRRRLRQLPHGASPHAHRRGRRARRRRSRRGLHDARRARHRRPAGDGDRRRRGRPLAEHARDRRVLPGHRRRRHAQRRRRLQGDRLRRRRGHDRLAAGPCLRGARPGLSLGHGDVPPDAPARRARQDRAERHARGDPHRARARERRHVQPHGRPAHVDGDLRLQGHRGVQPRRADDRAGAADRGQAAADRAGHRHGRPRIGRRRAVRTRPTATGSIRSRPSPTYERRPRHRGDGGHRARRGGRPRHHGPARGRRGRRARLRRAVLAAHRAPRA